MYINEISFFFLFFFSCGAFIMSRGQGKAGGSVLGSGFPHGGQDIAQLLLLPLGADVCSHLFLDELEGPFVLGDLELLHGMLPNRVKPHTSGIISRMNLVCLVRHLSGTCGGSWAWACSHSWPPCGPC